MDRKINSIEIRKNEENCVFLIHGYTGSPTDFGSLYEQLDKEFNADIVCPLLPGHGTRVEELYGLKLSEYISFIEKEFKRESKNRKKIVLVGISLGAQLALYLATKYKVNAVVLVSQTHYLRPFGKIPFLESVGIFIKKFPKRYSNNEVELRKNAFSYNFMPSESLEISKQLSKLVEVSLNKIESPCLIIHGKGDRLGTPYKLDKILKKIKSDIKKLKILKVRNHNLFYSEKREAAIKEIVSFVDKQLFNKVKEKASAIIPAYNEEERIEKIIKCLLKAKYIGEIIVIDDGSKDKTSEIVKKFKKVRLIKNEKNIGKGASMDKGVKLSKNDVIFFCDADLVDFKPEHADEIILPVLLNQTDMFIGMRGNFMQRTVTAWGLNSGERALRKRVWTGLPNFYKYRYRIEAGLNYYVKNYLGGINWKMFEYTQPIKEKKYGFFKGTFLRWWMNLDVVFSYFSFPFIYENEKRNSYKR